MKQDSFLALYRQKHNLTQYELSDQIGITQGVLARLERNIGNYNVRQVLKWCQLNNISPDKIYPPEASA